MNTPNFRIATLKDLPRIVEIYNSTIPSRMVTADTEPITVESRIKWFEEHRPDKWPLWIVEEQNQPVGWASLHAFYKRPAYDTTAEVSIYLDATMRGKGLGSQVLQHCMDHCHRFGIHTLLGLIFAHNGPSLNMFKRAGFEQWGMLPRVATLDGIERSVLIMGKRIQ
jgi:L-amino acid N-acyltransferase YncA